ncbi:hypothetical protein, partial [Peribacillus frigoritolerans]|uniref:hypothetical protein n=1 Tax=Peribacillus frigoritolerans TaxID=450367 RepID=UPI002E2402D3|nr:hypothetical protein [Peribacillus frigoritolerans]
VEINGSSFTTPQKKCRQKEFYLTVKTKLIGAGVRDSCGKCESKGDPAGDCFDAAWQTFG